MVARKSLESGSMLMGKQNKAPSVGGRPQSGDETRSRLCSDLQRPASGGTSLPVWPHPMEPPTPYRSIGA